MKKALIGFSGLIGKNLKDQTNFQYKFNTKNINSIQKQTFNIVVCAAAPGKMHIANQYPEEDKRKIQSLIKNLKKLKTDKFILISTIQVFEKLNNKNNEYSKKYNNSITYGKNRRMLEVFCKKHFKDFLIIRLPSVFGKHLKKNFIFDLFNSLPMMLNNDRYQKILNKIPYEIKKNFKCNYRKKNEKFYLKKNLNISKLNKKKIEVFLKKSNLDAFTRTGSTFLHQDPEMVNILFSPGSIELGENTPLFQIGDSVIVARAKAHRLPSTRDFVEVQGDIQSFIMNQEAMKLANDYADGLKNDESLVFGDLSQDDGIQVEDFQILRNSTNYSRGLSDAIFSLKKDLINEEIVVFSELEKVYLAKVSSVDTGNLSLFSDQERSDAKSDLSEQYGSQDLDGLAQSLRDNAEVFIEPGLYEGLFDL